MWNAKWLIRFFTNIFFFQNEPGNMEKPNKNPIQRLTIFINKYIDLSLVKEPIFIMMVISVMTMSVGVPHVLFFIPTYVRRMEGSATLDPAVLLCATSISDLGSQSFTSLMAVLRQDINWVSSFSRCLNGTFPWRKSSIKALVIYAKREDLYLLLFLFGLLY